MNHPLPSLRPTVMALIAASLTALPLCANDETPVIKKNDYFFRHKEQPVRIESLSGTSALASSKFTISNLAGMQLHAGKDTVTCFKVSPACLSYGTITRNKKGVPALTFLSLSESELKLANFDRKHLGNPLSLAYTPDGRGVTVATDKGLVNLDSRKFKMLTASGTVKFNPSVMVYSPNGYYIAMIGGSKVALYNVESDKIRKTWDFDANITDVNFSPDSRDIGILTDDGLLEIYDTRSLSIKTTVDDLGDGLAFDFNDSGKYVAVATGPDEIQVVNLLKHADRETIDVPDGFLSDLIFMKDYSRNTFVTYNSLNSLRSHRLPNLEPYYAKLVSDEVDQLMAEWMKMRDGETMDEYRLRMSDENVARQRRLFEDSISTDFAGDMLAMSTMSLGSYDRANQLLAVDFSNMPTIYLPVPEANIGAFHSGEDLTVSEAQYGLLPDDSFELVYGRFHNRNDNRDYIYDNHDRVAMTFLENPNPVSLEVLQQQQMEELRLQEIKERVVAEAKKQNVISDHTNITVDSRVVPDYDADGNKILNYVVKFSYQVEPEFSATEDFAPGKYHITESGAGSSMLRIVKEALEGDLAQYVKAGKKLRVDISGTADAAPIVRGIPYDGSYGEYEGEPIRQNGQLGNISVTKAEGIKTNEQLAFVRALGVRDFLEKNVGELAQMSPIYNYDISVSADKGGEHRRITSTFTFIDAF